MGSHNHGDGEVRWVKTCDELGCWWVDFVYIHEGRRIFVHEDGDDLEKKIRWCWHEIPGPSKYLVKTCGCWGEQNIFSSRMIHMCLICTYIWASYVCVCVHDRSDMKIMFFWFPSIFEGNQLFTNQKIDSQDQTFKKYSNSPPLFSYSHSSVKLTLQFVQSKHRFPENPLCS